MTLMPPEKKAERFIRPLPKQLVNKIAAGEVVERPASVVKELVENAIDSGADQIEIVIEKSGVKLIRIIDNGCGIGEDQIEIAFSRHATSKISNFRDLDTLDSYGFRGEALPSIASVSRVRMVSRPHNASSGTEIIYEGGVLQSKKPIAAAVGTTIEVENLFYNTPARRKFLKAESTEARHISRYAMALAMGRPEIGINYTLNGRKLFAQRAGETLNERVGGVLGAGRKFVAVCGESEPVAVQGHIGVPDTAQHNRNSQFVFVNNRYISSPTLSHAFNSGYGELIPRGQHPIGVLCLSIDPQEIDVNVHPSKTEVRLVREREIHDAVYRIVKEALRQDTTIPSVTASRSEVSTARDESERPEVSQQFIPGIGSQAGASADLVGELMQRQATTDSSHSDTDIIKVDRATGEILASNLPAASSPDAAGPSSGFRFIGRFSDLYLLLQAGDDLYVVDQHTAHERVLYEEMLRRVEERSVDAQRMLFPEQVELTAEQLAVFDEYEELLNNSGFGVSHFGGRMVNIEATPTILSTKSAQKMLLGVLDDLSSQRKGGEDIKKAMAQSMACRAAVMAGDRLSDEEATHLLKRLLACRDRYSCPHGRPTFLRFDRDYLNRQFGRG